VYVHARIRKWKAEYQVHGCPACVSACQAIAFQAEVTGSADEITGIGMSHLESQADPMSLYGTDVTDFADFLTKNWGDAYQAGFVDHLQPINLEISCLILLVVARKDGKVKDGKLIASTHSKDSAPKNTSR
jgi:hypothetical protein